MIYFNYNYKFLTIQYKKNKIINKLNKNLCLYYYDIILHDNFILKKGLNVYYFLKRFNNFFYFLINLFFFNLNFFFFNFKKSILNLKKTNTNIIFIFYFKNYKILKKSNTNTKNITLILIINYKLKNKNTIFQNYLNIFLYLNNSYLLLKLTKTILYSIKYLKFDCLGIILML